MNQRSPHSYNLLPFSIIFSLSALFVITTAVPARGQTDVLAAIENRITSIVKTAEPSVVSIARVPRPALSSALRPLRPIDANPDDPANPEFIPHDFGSGILISTANSAHPQVILTNYHVVKGGPVYGNESGDFKVNVFVWLNNRRKFLASILAADPHSDLAVLSVNRRVVDARKHPGLKIEPVKDLRKGMFVFAFGNPYAQARDGSPTVSWGNVSNIARKPVPTLDIHDGITPRLQLHDFGTMLQMSTQLPLGTSGGAVLDRQGRLIAMTTARAALLGYEQSAGYAIPFEPGIARIVHELAQGLEAEYGFLGVSTNNADRADLAGTPFAETHPSAAIVNHVFPNSAADIGGLAFARYRGGHQSGSHSQSVRSDARNRPAGTVESQAEKHGERPGLAAWRWQNTDAYNSTRQVAGSRRRGNYYNRFPV